MDPRIPPGFLLRVCSLCRAARTRALLTCLIVPSTYIVWPCTNGTNRIEQAQQQQGSTIIRGGGATAANSQQKQEVPAGPVSREDRQLLVPNGPSAGKGERGCENCVGTAISGGEVLGGKEAAAGPGEKDVKKVREEKRDIMREGPGKGIERENGNNNKKKPVHTTSAQTLQLTPEKNGVYAGGGIMRS